MLGPWVIAGPPRTKKNHGRIIRAGGRPRMLPSAAYEAWDAAAQIELRSFISRLGGHTPISVPVNCRALFYRDALRGDAVGFYQALADTLEKAGVVSDDKFIVSWDGSRLLKDSERPRVQFSLEATL